MVSPDLNTYGDSKTETTGRHGSDIASQRIDDLDRACLSDILSGALPVEGRALDLGAGLGYHAVRMAALGAPVVSVDILDLTAAYDHIRQGFPALDIVHVTGRIEDLLDVPDLQKLNLLYSQRTLHYLRYSKVVTVLKSLRDRMNPDARAYLSMSGLNSELGHAYPDAAAPIASRWSCLSEPLTKKHGIVEPVCLYAEPDIHTLADAVGFDIVQLWSSDFGNVKAILKKS